MYCIKVGHAVECQDLCLVACRSKCEEEDGGHDERASKSSLAPNVFDVDEPASNERCRDTADYDDQVVAVRDSNAG